MIYSDMVPREIQTTHTIAACVLGEHSHSEALLYDICVRNTVATTILWLMFAAGAFVGILVVAEAIPKSFVWVSLLMLPLPFAAFMLLNADLYKEILSAMDVHVIYILQVALVVDGIYYCGADHRIVFWICYLPSMVTSGLIDAYPAKYRPLFSKAFTGCHIAILLAWNAFLLFKFKVVGDTVGKLKDVSFLVHHVADQATLLLFYFRHLWSALYHPNCFIMIKADVFTDRADLSTPMLCNDA